MPNIPAEAKSPHTEIVRNLFHTGEAKDSDQFAAFFTSDGHYRFGNPEPVVGRKGVRDSVAAFFPLVKSLYHDVHRMWEQDNTLLLEMQVVYTLHDGRVVALPCADIFEFEGDLVKEMQIFMDPSPITASVPVTA